MPKKRRSQKHNESNDEYQAYCDRCDRKKEQKRRQRHPELPKLEPKQRKRRDRKPDETERDYQLYCRRLDQNITGYRRQNNRDDVKHPPIMSSSPTSTPSKTSAADLAQTLLSDKAFRDVLSPDKASEIIGHVAQTEMTAENTRTEAQKTRTVEAMTKFVLGSPDRTASDLALTAFFQSGTIGGFKSAGGFKSDRPAESESKDESEQENVEPASPPLKKKKMSTTNAFLASSHSSTSTSAAPAFTFGGRTETSSPTKKKEIGTDVTNTLLASSHSSTSTAAAPAFSFGGRTDSETSSDFSPPKKKKMGSDNWFEQYTSSASTKKTATGQKNTSFNTLGGKTLAAPGLEKPGFEFTSGLFGCTGSTSGEETPAVKFTFGQNAPNSEKKTSAGVPGFECTPGLFGHTGKKHAVELPPVPFGHTGTISDQSGSDERHEFHDFKPGMWAWHKMKNKKVKVVQVHADPLDPNNPFFTMAYEDGREFQTELKYLQPLFTTKLKNLQPLV